MKFLLTHSYTDESSESFEDIEEEYTPESVEFEINYTKKEWEDLITSQAFRDQIYYMETKFPYRATHDYCGDKYSEGFNVIDSESFMAVAAEWKKYFKKLGKLK